MKTCTLKKVIRSIWEACGISPDSSTITAAQNTRMASTVTDILKDAFESEFWQPIMLVEKRTLDANKSIAFAATGQTEIGGIDPLTGVSLDDPQYTQNPRIVSPCIVIGDKLIVQDTAVEASGDVYLYFRPVSPEFTMTAWSSLTTYAVGDLSYLDSTGYVYKSLLAANLNHSPDSSPTYWAVVYFPDLFRTYVKLAASATRMTEDEGRGKQLGEARTELEHLRDVYIHQQDKRSRRVIFAPLGARK
jgi:hypothetical protein